MRPSNIILFKFCLATLKRFKFLFSHYQFLVVFLSYFVRELVNNGFAIPLLWMGLIGDNFDNFFFFRLRPHTELENIIRKCCWKCFKVKPTPTNTTVVQVYKKLNWSHQTSRWRHFDKIIWHDIIDTTSSVWLITL